MTQRLQSVLPATKQACCVAQLLHGAFNFIGSQLGRVIVPRRVREICFAHIAPTPQFIELLIPFRQDRQLADIGCAPVLGVERAELFRGAH